jgi:DNA polymerase I-like protein with 3'-5' exonuclease and polymerase domains
LNWNSTDQLKPVLHKLGVMVEDCQIDTLEAAMKKHPLVAHIVAYRKERSRYDRLVERLQHRGPDDRIHATWKQLGARTGRTSCAAPNLQNISRDPEIRACYIPGPGHIFLDLDFNQIEPRVLAALCGDERMLEAFRQKLDLYCWIAAELLDKPIEEIDPDGWERKWGKQMLLATMYGQQARSLAASMSKAAGRHVSDIEAAEHLNKFRQLFPKITEWSGQQRSLVKQGSEAKYQNGREYREDYGETVTIRGRKRLVRSPSWKAPMQVLNAPVQGSAADAAKETLALLYETQEAAGGAFLVNFIHDEFLVECPDKPESIAAAQKWLFEAAVKGLESVLGDVPLGITEDDIVVGYKWTKQKKERLIEEDDNEE